MISAASINRRARRSTRTPTSRTEAANGSCSSSRGTEGGSGSGGILVGESIRYFDAVYSKLGSSSPTEDVVPVRASTTIC